MFEDDQQLQKFLECIDEFSESLIDEDEESSENDGKASYKNMIVGQEIIDLKTNHIPRGLVPLERLFDNNDVYLRSDGKVKHKIQLIVILKHLQIQRMSKFQSLFLQKLELSIRKLLVSIQMCLHGHIVI